MNGALLLHISVLILRNVLSLESILYRVCRWRDACSPTLLNWQGILSCCDCPCTQVLSIPDNDQLSAHVATSMRADLLILLSDVEGIYSGHPSEPGSRLIRTYYPEHSRAVKFWGKSRVGRGGMESKVRLASE